MKFNTLFASFLTAAVVSADTKARVAVSTYVGDQCQGSNPLTTSVYDTTVLFGSA